MTKSINVHQAKTHLSQLLDEAEAGVDVVIARAGIACARLVAVKREPRTPGLMAGIWPSLELHDSFFDPLPDEELSSWES